MRSEYTLRYLCLHSLLPRVFFGGSEPCCCSAVFLRGSGCGAPDISSELETWNPFLLYQQYIRSTEYDHVRRIAFYCPGTICT